jgi:hypothetical protein
VKHKVSELEGELLDAAVAKTIGFSLRLTAEGSREWWQFFEPSLKQWCAVLPFSTDWINGGPIIGIERISLDYEIAEGSPVAASLPDQAWLVGPTALVAAMRAYVASEFGEEVELP